MYVLSIKVPIWKKSGNLFNDPRTYSSAVLIRNVSLKTYQKQLTIEKGRDKGAEISVLMAWHDNDDDDMRMPMWDRAVSVLSQTQRAAGCPTEAVAHCRPPVEYPRPTRRMVEDNAAYYGQDKKKLWVNMAISIHLPLTVSFSHQQKRWLQEE